MQSSLILLTGMSGAGKKAAAVVLEELGWYVADNLPPELILRMVELGFEEDSPIERLAIAADVRSLAFAGSLSEVLATLKEHGASPTVLFLDANDETLIARYDALRRTHPLQTNGTLQDGIDRERTILEHIRETADIIMDTSKLSVHDLRRNIEDLFAGPSAEQLRVNITSFGFKNGPPKDVDILLDARFLANPYWEPELRKFRGTDPEVADYVLGQPDAENFMRSAEEMLLAMIPGYVREGKKFLSVAIGCTGGHHRSVAVAKELGRRLEDAHMQVRVSHRDINR